MTAQVCYLENVLTPQNRIIRDIEPCSIQSLAPDWQIPFIAFVDGQPVLRADWELVIEDGQSLVFLDVNCIPQGGGVGSNPLRIVAMLAVMYFTAGAGAGWLVGAGSLTGATGFAGSMIGYGAMIAGSALISAVLPPPQPTSPQSANAMAAASPTYNLQAQGNAARLEAAIPEHFGRLVAYPDFAAQPYQEFAGNEQYIYQLLCIGRGYYDIEATRIEDTLISVFDDITSEVVQPGGVLSLFPANVVSSIEVSGQTMATGTYLGPFIASAANSTANFIGVDFIAPRGLYYANDDGSLASVSVVVVVEAALVNNLGVMIGGWTVLSASTAYTPWSSWTYSSAGFTPVTVYDGDGNPSVIWTAPVNTLTNEYIGGAAPQTRTRSTSSGVETFSGSTTTPQRYSRRYPVAPGRYQVRIKRTDTEQTTTRYGHNFVWAGMRSYLQDNRTFGDVTLLALRMRASNSLSMQSSRKINVIATRKIPIWNGSVWSANTATRSIAWPLAYAAKEVGLTDAQIDLPALLALDATWTARGDTFNARFDNFLSFWEAVTKIAGAGRAKPYMQGGVMRFMRDQMATIPVALFSMRNIVKGSFNVDYLMPTSETADAVNVGYFDGTVWSPSRVQAKLPGSVVAKPVKVDLFGVTSRDQAFREGMYLAATNRYRRKSIHFSTEMEGFIPSFGDLIAIQHDMPAWGQGGEITVWDAVTRTATLSEVPTWGTGTHYIGLRKRDGSVDGPYVVTAGTATNQVVLASVPSFIPYTGGNEERTHYSFGWAETWRQRARVLSAKPQGLYQVAIEAVNENDNVHTADSGVVTPVAPVSQLAGYTNTPVVTGVTVMPMPYNPDKLLVSWQPAAWSDHYLIEQSKDGLTWTQAGSTGTGSYVVVALYGASTLIRVAAVGISKGPWSTSSTVTVSPTPVPLPPTAIATGGMFSVHLSWTFGDTLKTIAGTEVWWSATNDRTSAARLTVEPFPKQEYNHVALQAGQGGYYWIRVADTFGGISAWYPASPTAGLYATASADPSALLLQLQNSVGMGQLAADLATPIQLVTPLLGSANAMAIASIQTSLSDYDISSRMLFQEAVTNATITKDPITGAIQLLSTAVTTTDVESRLSAAEVKVNAATGSVALNTAAITTTQGNLTTTQSQVTALQGAVGLSASTTYVDTALGTATGALTVTAANAALALSNAAIQEALDAFTQGQSLTAMTQNVATAQEQIKTSADALQSEVVSRAALVATVASNGAAIVTNELVRATATAALASRATALEATVNDVTTGVASKASVSYVDTAKASAISTSAGSIATVQSQLNTGGTTSNAIATAQGTANTGVTNAATAQTQANTATTNAATAQTTANTAVTASNANATTTTQVQARLDTGDYAAVKTQSSASASAVTGLQAQYVVKVDANGRVAGMQLASGAGGASITMLADKFLWAIETATPGVFTAPKQALILGNLNGVPTLGLDGNLIVDGSVVARSLAVDSVTAAKIKAGEITANKLASKTITAASGVIGDLAVDSLQIAGNAVTVMKGATADNWNRVSVTITVAAGDIPSGSSTVPIVITGSADCNSSYAAYAPIDIGRNVIDFNVVGNLIASQPAAGLSSATIVDNQPPGTYTYSLYQHGFAEQANNYYRKISITAILGKR